MRDTFVRALISAAKKYPEMELLTGDLGFGVLKPYWEALPDQFLNVGIAEQNMTAMAAGMALEGKNVFTYSIGNFPTLRCLEQIRNDCAYHQANVKIVCVGGGLAYGSLGMSHHATEDLAVMRALPGVCVLAPGDPTEAEACTEALAEYQGTAYLRLGRGGEKRIHEKIDAFRIGQALKIRDGERIALFSTGAILEEASAACDILTRRGLRPALYSFPTVKPLDRETVERAAGKFSLIVTCEEHNLPGGFGAAVAEVLAEMRNKSACLLRVGMPDCYSALVGDNHYLRTRYGLDAQSVADKVIKAIEA